MGLDNGIDLTISASAANKLKIPDWIADRFSTRRVRDDKVVFEDICYWRKWWPLRNLIMATWKPAAESGGECGVYEIDKDFVSICSLYIHDALFDPGSWEKKGSIFDWENMTEGMVMDLLVFIWIVEQLSDPAFKGKFEFYDSY